MGSKTKRLGKGSTGLAMLFTKSGSVMMLLTLIISYSMLEMSHFQMEIKMALPHVIPSHDFFYSNLLIHALIEYNVSKNHSLETPHDKIIEIVSK